jgi:exopolysaccharide production protein ExoQ
MSVFDRSAFRAGFAVFVLFTLFAGDFWRYSVGWIGFGVGAVVITVISVITLIRDHRSGRWRVGHLPYPLLGFMALATVSVFWSFYPGATLLGLLTTWMTVITAVSLAASVSWPELLRALGIALRLILGLSLLFEVVVAVIIRRPVLPFVPAPGIDYSSYEKIPKLLLWSRNELFEVFDGGKIQGIVGNSSLLGFIALLALIVFGVQLANGSIGHRWGVTWLALTVVTAFFTRSATITVAIVAVTALVLALIAVRRASTPRRRTVIYWSLGGAVVLAAGAAFLLRNSVLAALGKSEDLTGRLDIWDAVIGLAQQRPAFGWGWVSYWVPWVEPFDTLAFKSGVRQLHAHNAWLDIWLQLGILGLIVFGALVLSTTARTWLIAVDRPRDFAGKPAAFTASSLLPILLMAALLIQSLAESRLLVEYGLLMLVVIAVKTKHDPLIVREVS